jgi:NitT/TauT family transport system substrate-binding protein
MTKNLIRRTVAALGALALMTGVAFAQAKVTIAIGGAECLCYLPTMLAEQLGEYKKAGVDVEMVKFKGGSDALEAVIGGSADVVSGYFDHCVNRGEEPGARSARGYDRYPGFTLVVSPKHTGAISSIKDLKDKKVG